MQFDKSQVLDLLRSRGQHDTAAQAEGELPDTVDTDRDGGLLERLGLSPMEIVSALAGGGGIGGIAGRLAGAAGAAGAAGGGDREGEGDRKDEGGGIGGALGGLLGR